MGHLIIAQHVLNFTDYEQVWLVCTPHNPDKQKKSLLAEHFRLEMLHLATAEQPQIQPCDAEFYLNKPSYTVNTLLHLKQRFPQHQFALLMGQDNSTHFPTWQGFEWMVEHFPILVYPRLDAPAVIRQEWMQTVHFLNNVPLLNISASYIRELLKSGKKITYLVHPAVEQYIEKQGFYRG